MPKPSNPIIIIKSPLGGYEAMRRRGDGTQRRVLAARYPTVDGVREALGRLVNYGRIPEGVAIVEACE